MCDSIAEGGRRCGKVHKPKKTIKEIEADEETYVLASDKPQPGTLQIRVSPDTARQIADMPGVHLHYQITSPVEEEPFDVASYLRRSARNVDTEAQNLTIKKNTFLTGEEREALTKEAELLGVPVSSLAQLKATGGDPYAHIPSIRKNQREDREVWMSIPREDRERIVAERLEAQADVEAAQQRIELVERVQAVTAQGEGAIRARAKELEDFIVLHAGGKNNKHHAAVGWAMREKKLLASNLQELQDQKKEHEHELQSALARRQRSFDKALALLTVAAAVLPRRTRPFSNAFIMGFSTVARMQRGA